MSASYVAAVDKLGWLLDAIEGQLGASADRAPVTTEFARSASAVRRPTNDEAAVALRALTDLGVLGPAPRRLLNLERFHQTAQFRFGVRAGLDARPKSQANVRLCVAIPPTLVSPSVTSLRRSTEDLRGSLLDLIASSKSELVLASPFWDDATIGELGPLLAKRLRAGVHLKLLGRFHEAIPAKLSALALNPRCSLFSWFESSDDDRFGSHTFHFKTAIADGIRAYLGTANFTESGLRSRLEFGVMLDGEAARQLSTVVQIVLTMAQTIEPITGKASDRA